SRLQASTSGTRRTSASGLNWGRSATLPNGFEGQYSRWFEGRTPDGYGKTKTAGVNPAARRAIARWTDFANNSDRHAPPAHPADGGGPGRAEQEQVGGLRGGGDVQERVGGVRGHAEGPSGRVEVPVVDVVDGRPRVGERPRGGQDRVGARL